MRKLLATLLALAFILGFAVNAIAWSALDALFSPNTYVGIVRESAFVNATTALVHDEVANRLVQGAGNLGSLFTPDDAKWVAEQLITGPWLTAQMERWLGALFDWIKSDTPQPTLILSLAELKQEAPDIARTLVAEKLRQLPPCTLERVAKALEALLSGREIPLCLPPNFDVDGFVRSDVFNLSGRLQEAMRSAPDRVDVLSLGEGGESAASLVDGLNQIRRTRQQARNYLTGLGAALVGAFLLIGVLRWNPKRALLQWWGWSLMLGGGLALAAFGLFYASQGALWQWVATSPNGAMPADILPMAQAAFDGIMAAVWSRVLLLGGAGAAVGLVLAALSFALPRAKAPR